MANLTKVRDKRKILETFVMTCVPIERKIVPKIKIFDRLRVYLKVVEGKIY